MAWIELHDTLPDHDKVIAVATALNVDKDLVVGKLVRLWTWALANREDGVFRMRDIATIAEVMRFKGKPQRLVDALVQSRLLDCVDDTYIIHDWDERVGMLLAKREVTRSQARERQRKKREQNGNVTRDNSVTDENVTGECHACHAVTVPKPYQKDDDDDVDVAYMRAREENEDEYDALYEEAKTRILSAFREFFGRTPTKEEVLRISRIAVMSGKVPLIGEAIRLAAVNGARSVGSYILPIIEEWKFYRIDTIEELEEYSMLCDMRDNSAKFSTLEPQQAISKLMENRQAKIERGGS